jgi:hypothetical protein
MQNKLAKPVIVLVAAGLLGLYQHFQKPQVGTDKPASSPISVSVSDSRQTEKTATGGANTPALQKIRAAQNNPDARFWTTVQGTVVKNLRDDREGNPHQRFLLEIAPDITLLVAHNIDLAKRVPVQEGEQLTVSGEYVWNNRGGVLHWTHHDPKGRKGGWIELNGQRYD